MIEDLVNRLRLLRTPGIGPVTFRQLVTRFGTPAAALQAVPDLARRGGGKVSPLCRAADAENEIARVEKIGAKWLTVGQGLYPRLLTELEDAPSLIMAKGNLNLLSGMPWRSSVLAMRRRPRAALPAVSHMILASTISSSFRGSRGGSTVRHMTERSKLVPSQ